MKRLLLPLLFCACSVQAQTSKLTWHTVAAIPASDVYSVKNINGVLYAGAPDKVYVSNTKGDSWRSSTLTPAPLSIEDFIENDRRIYAAGPGQGVYVSDNGGVSWSSFNTGLTSVHPQRFATRKSQLYVATGDQAVYRWDAEKGQWQSFAAGLYPGTSYVFEAFANTDSGLIGGTGANGLLTLRHDTAAAWAYRYVTGTVSPPVGTSELLQAGKRVWAFTTYGAFASEDQGQNWTPATEGMRKGYSSRAIMVGDSIYATCNFGGNNVIIYKRGTEEPLTATWTVVDTLLNYFPYGLAAHNGRLYLATHRGLIYTTIAMPTAIPGPAMPTVKVYPNPVQDYLVVEHGLSAGVHSFMLFDALGKNVLTAVMHADRQIIDMGKLPAGTYYYRLVSGAAPISTGTVTGCLSNKH